MPGPKPKYEIKIGYKFGNRTIIGKKSKDGRFVWLSKCISCKGKSIVDSRQIKRGSGCGLCYSPTRTSKTITVGNWELIPNYNFGKVRYDATCKKCNSTRHVYSKKQADIECRQCFLNSKIGKKIGDLVVVGFMSDYVNAKSLKLKCPRCDRTYNQDKLKKFECIKCKGKKHKLGSSLLSKQELADRAGVSLHTIYNRIKSGLSIEECIKKKEHKLYELYGEYFSIAELSKLSNCSEGTMYQRINTRKLSIEDAVIFKPRNRWSDRYE